jgi:sarcosine oxidase
VKTESCDVLVIGLGAMGAATVYQLAKRGVKVKGVDQFTPPHTRGSTHGETRITRAAIGEGLQFVPLAMRSHQLWREIEHESGETLFNACGGLILARAGRESWMHDQRDFLGNTFRAAEAFGIAHERLSARDIAARFPQFVLQGDEYAYFEPGAGYLAPEACVRAQLQLAAQYSADLSYGEKVICLTSAGKQTIVETDRARYTPGTTIVTAGPWVPTLLPTLAARLTIRRQVLYWFEREVSNVSADSILSYRADNFPIFIWHWGAGEDDVFYGFPQIDDANNIKVASEQRALFTTPEAVDRIVSQTEITEMYANHIAGKLRGISARCVKAATCLYTNAPAANFIIDRLPDAPDTIVVSACSGHGFKHSAAIGEAVATMAISRATPKVLTPFALNETPE